MEMVDSFYYIFNKSDFSNWSKYSWPEQEKSMEAMKVYKSYQNRMERLISKSQYYHYIPLQYREINLEEIGVNRNFLSDSDYDEISSYAMMRKMLLAEGYYNSVDAISYAAYHGDKYNKMLPGIKVMLYKYHQNGKSSEEVVIIDNGVGQPVDKPSRESAMIRSIYSTYKRWISRKGVYYIGGYHLGLLKSKGDLHLFDNQGAVVRHMSYWEVFGTEEAIQQAQG